MNNKDSYIKNQLQKDELISKKANDVFENFFKEGVKMENNEEKVVDINSSKDKKLRKKKILATVASLMIVFLAANGYAATQGYNNIFFIIKNAITGERVTDKNEILSDRDILISYSSIKIESGLYLQVNNLIVKENEGTLTLKVIETEEIKRYPYRYLVYDLDTNEEIGNQKTTREEYLGDEVYGEYHEEIKLTGMNNSTQKIQLKVNDESDENIVTLNIDLENKEIDIISGIENEMKKISEVELKEVLSIYTALNYPNDCILEKTEDIKLYQNEAKIIIGSELIFYKELEENPLSQETDSDNADKIHKAIKEFTGEEITEPIETAGYLKAYDENENAYVYTYATDEVMIGKCLEIENISYYNGIYEVTFSYCYPGIGNIDEIIGELNIYKTTMKFKLNENYEYTKYCLVDIDTIENELVSGENISEKYVENELKNALTQYAKLNFWKDNSESMMLNLYSEEAYFNDTLVEVAARLTDISSMTNIFTFGEIHTAIKEFYGKDISQPLKTSNIVMTYDENNNYYKSIGSLDMVIKSACIDIEDCTLLDGVYSITYTYCYPFDVNYVNINDFDIYRGTIKLIENENYTYAKYRIVEGSMTNELIREAMVEEYNDENIIDENNNTIVDGVSNTIVTENNSQIQNYNTINSSVTNTTVTTNSNKKVDNYASTMEWTRYTASGLEFSYPTEWILTESEENNSENLLNKVLVWIEGIATGINKETNEIVESNVTLTIYEPENVDIGTEEEYYEYIANKMGGNYEGAAIETEKAGKWIEVYSYWGEPDGGERQIIDYCHYEPSSEKGKGTGYVIRLYSDNYDNYKLTNIINCFFREVSI